ncbi:RNase adapter RapZ [Limosilactobacillus fermentum]|uniref:RNase adapter RapZ n=1 Tax=Limosilactobacillus fermentum TaxID=1613 RepID=UPI001FCCA163|nr:RNase adapter RapZ [Limosilactobacillus fermentum]MCJ2387342.1 RNase adapter RapZ [Limosilactobacillus fermentum]
MAEQLEVVIITGMSGAGKTVAVQSFEDLGYFVIDNMIPSVATKFVDAVKQSGEITRMAMVMDSRSREFYNQVVPCVAQLRGRSDLTLRLLFLEATDEELVSRYKESRRAHPLSHQDGVLPGIMRERQLLNDLKSQADLVVDTTTLTPRQLKQRITERFSPGEARSFYVNVMSFGFKYGLPLDADLVIDVRFLPNPYYIPDLKHQTGNDPAVQAYVMDNLLAQNFYQHLYSLIEVALPGYIKEGKSSLTIAIGCTGGQHRSVTIANRLAADLKNNQYPVHVHHRDVDKAN